MIWCRALTCDCINVCKYMMQFRMVSVLFQLSSGDVQCTSLHIVILLLSIKSNIQCKMFIIRLIFSDFAGLFSVSVTLSALMPNHSFHIKIDDGNDATYLSFVFCMCIGLRLHCIVLYTEYGIHIAYLQTHLWLYCNKMPLLFLFFCAFLEMPWFNSLKTSKLLYIL